MKRMQMLTPKQKQLYDYLEAFVKEHEYLPSVREIAKGLDKTVSPVAKLLVQLENKGYITRTDSTARNYQLTGGDALVDELEKQLKRVKPRERIAIEKAISILKELPRTSK